MSMSHDINCNEAELHRVYYHHYNGWVRRFKNGAFEGIECIHFSPCGICYRCEEHAPHLYYRCENCPAGGCDHTYDDKVTLLCNDHIDDVR